MPNFKSILCLTLGLSGFAFAQTGIENTFQKNPECRTIINRLKEINTPSLSSLNSIQATVESMDEFKVSMMGDGYKFVIESMSQYMNSGLVRTDVLLAAECDRVLEETRLARTERSATEFNGYLQNQRSVRENALRLMTEEAESKNNSCSGDQKRPFLSLVPECPPLNLNPILPESTNFMREVNVRLSESYKIDSPGLNLLNFRPQTESQMFQGSLTVARSPLSRRTFLTLNRFGMKDCNCALETMTSLITTYGAAEIGQKEAVVKDGLKGLILESFGEKFENDFANNFEDLSYFMNTNAKVFPDEATMDNLQCADQASYTNAIKAKCGSKSSSVIDERLKKILGVTQSELGDKLKGIAVSATGVATGKKHADGSPVMYTREDMDGQRRQLLTDLPELRFYDRLIHKIFSDTNLKKAMDEHLQSIDPQAAIYATMVNGLRMNPALIESLDPSLKTSGFVTEIKRLIAANDTTGLYNLVNGGLNNFQDNYPGFKSLLKSKDNLSRFRLSNPGAQGSLVEEIEKDKTFLNEDFNKRCTELQQNLAEAVCAEEESLISKADPKEVEKLIIHHRPDLIEHYDIYSDMLCRSQGNASPAFAGLDVDTLPIAQQSDYSQRKMSEEKKEPSRDMLTAYMVAHRDDPNLKAYMEDSTRTVANRRVAYTGAGRLGGEMLANNSTVRRYDPKFEKEPGSEAFVARKSIPAPTVASTTKSESSAETAPEIKPEEMISQVQPQIMPSGNYQNLAAPTQVVANADSRERTDMKAALRDFINEKEEDAASERMLSDIDDEQLKELNRLKALTEEGQNELMRLSKQTEEVKLKDMEKKLKALQNRRSEVARTLTDTNSSQDRNTERSNGRSPSSISRAETPDPARAASRIRVPDAISARQDSTASSAPARPFVVKGADSQASLEIRPSKMSDELLNYLSQNETEISSLIQLKDAGMLYKFKVKENGQWVEKEILVNYEALTDDVKKMIDQKIAQNPNGSKLVKLDEEIKALKRSHSYASLRNIITEQVRR